MRTFTTATNSFKYFTQDFKFIKTWIDKEKIDFVFFEGRTEDLPNNAKKVATGVWALETD